jgi:iron complex outermembrane receptor protein
VIAAGLAMMPWAAGAQAGSSLLRVRVVENAIPIEGATIRIGTLGALTSAVGVAALRVGPGTHTLIAGRIGFMPETLTVSVVQDTSIEIALEPISTELGAVVVTATRAERRIEEEPIRVEVIAREEIEEKLLMTPGDITMMLNETSGLRVQTTSPSLGGANVRVQGLRGRYTQLLSDGLPLFGGQTGSLGLLQIPPMDLGQVEVIKGAASALYGASALGGVVNLISRRPERARELLLNQTTRGGTDAVAYLASERGEGSGFSTLLGLHRQRRADVDGDGWADLPGYERGVVRPRGFWSNGAGASAFVTAGATLENRRGGTLPGRTVASGAEFQEGLRTARFDAGGIVRLARGTDLFSVRGSFTAQAHRHDFGPQRERDRHGTGFAEASWSRTLARHLFVVGAAVQHDRYRARDVRGFDHGFTVPALFLQEEFTPVEWLALSASARVDAHSEYGTSVSPRLSVLVRRAGWTLRASGGGGVFGPTPFTEETETVGLSRVRRGRALSEERARSASIDVGRLVGPLEVNVTAFASGISRPVTTRALDGDSLELLNAPSPTRTKGGEVVARFRREPFAVTATWALLRSREFDADAGRRVETALTPRQTASVVAVMEEHGVGRVGLEVYYTGSQRLEDNPYRARSPRYLVLGLLAERRVGPVRAFVNLENLGGVRQTEWDPLLLPAPGRGGRWTTDVWAPLEGRTINGGVRLEL